MATDILSDDLQADNIDGETNLLQMKNNSTNKNATDSAKVESKNLKGGIVEKLTKTSSMEQNKYDVGLQRRKRRPLRSQVPGYSEPIVLQSFQKTIGKGKLPEIVHSNEPGKEISSKIKYNNKSPTETSQETNKEASSPPPWSRGMEKRQPRLDRFANRNMVSSSTPKSILTYDSEKRNFKNRNEDEIQKNRFSKSPSGRRRSQFQTTEASLPFTTNRRLPSVANAYIPPTFNRRRSTITREFDLGGRQPYASFQKPFRRDLQNRARSRTPYGYNKKTSHLIDLVGRQRKQRRYNFLNEDELKINVTIPVNNKRPPSAIEIQKHREFRSLNDYDLSERILKSHQELLQNRWKRPKKFFPTEFDPFDLSATLHHGNRGLHAKRLKPPPTIHKRGIPGEPDHRRSMATKLAVLTEIANDRFSQEDKISSETPQPSHQDLELTSQEEVLMEEVLSKLEAVEPTLKSDLTIGKNEDVLSNDFHYIPIFSLYQLLQVSPRKGLTEEEATRRLKMNGQNEIDTNTLEISMKYFSKSMFSKFYCLLFLCSAICFIDSVTHERKEIVASNIECLQLGWFVLLGILVCCTMEQLIMAYAKGQMFRIFHKSSTRVLRNGTWKIKPTAEIVVGDIVEVVAGDVIPGDIRIIESSNFEVDENIIMENHGPMSRSPNVTSVIPWKTENVAFLSTNSSSGTAKGIVIGTGSKTIMGRFSTEPQHSYKHDKCILADKRRLVDFVIVAGIFWSISTIILSACLSIFRPIPLLSVAVLLAYLPEAILLVFAILFASTIHRLRKTKCEVRNFHSIESLALTTAVMIDINGILDQSRKSVSNVWINGKLFEMDTLLNFRNRKLEKLRTDKSWIAISNIIALCNNADFDSDSKNLCTNIFKRKWSGEVTDIALLRFFELTIGDAHEYRSNYSRLFDVPEAKGRNYHVSLYKDVKNDNVTLLMIGEPETVLSFCSTVLLNGKEYSIEDENITKYLDIVTGLRNDGNDVLACCDLLMNQKFDTKLDFKEDNLPMENLRFIGFVSTTSPPRISSCVIKHWQDEGLKVILVTSETGEKAISVGQDIGLATFVGDMSLYTSRETLEEDPSDCPPVMRMHDFLKMDDIELENIMNKQNGFIFAEANTSEKCKIVDLFQSFGEVVAAIGCNNEDIPSLKVADIGIVSFESDSDALLHSGDVIIHNTNLCMVKTLMEEGLFHFENWKRVVTYILTSNTPQLIPFLAYLVIGIPLAINPFIIIAIDLGSDLLIAISLCFEQRKHPGLKTRNPLHFLMRNVINGNLRVAALAQIGVIQMVAGFFTYFVIMAENGFLPDSIVFSNNRWQSIYYNFEDSYSQDWTYEQRKSLQYTAQTGYYIAIILTQWINLIVSRSRWDSIFKFTTHNYVATITLYITAVLAILLVFTGTGTSFHTYPIRFMWWLSPLPFMIIIIIYDEIKRILTKQGETHSWIHTELFF